MTFGFMQGLAIHGIMKCEIVEREWKEYSEERKKIGIWKGSEWVTKFGMVAWTAEKAKMSGSWLWWWWFDVWRMS